MVLTFANTETCISPGVGEENPLPENAGQAQRHVHIHWDKDRSPNPRVLPTLSKRFRNRPYRIAVDPPTSLSERVGLTLKPTSLR